MAVRGLYNAEGEFKGALYNSEEIGTSTNYGGGAKRSLGFDASRCCPVYGAGKHVKPFSYATMYYLKY